MASLLFDCPIQLANFLKILDDLNAYCLDLLVWRVDSQRDQDASVPLTDVASSLGAAREIARGGEDLDQDDLTKLEQLGGVKQQVTKI